MDCRSDPDLRGRLEGGVSGMGFGGAEYLCFGVLSHLR